MNLLFTSPINGDHGLRLASPITCSFIIPSSHAPNIPPIDTISQSHKYTVCRSPDAKNSFALLTAEIAIWRTSSVCIFHRSFSKASITQFVSISII